MVTFNPYEIPCDGVVLTENNTKAFLDDKDCGNGILCINESNLLWKGDDESKSFKLSYPAISLHAVSRDTSSFPHQCLYCLLESADLLDSEDIDPERPVTQVRFVPQNTERIKPLYDAVTKCQELHPDPDDMSDAEEADDDVGYYENFDDPSSITTLQGFYTSASNMDDVELSEEGMANLRRLQENMQIAEEEKGTNVDENGDNLNGQFDDVN